MDKTVKEIATGYIIQLGDKYFFVQAQYAGRVLEDGPPKLKTFDEDELIAKALQEFPEAQYFAINRSYGAFEPDEAHAWLK